MPYKKGKKYIGQIRRNGKRIERVFLKRSDALAWESEMRKVPEDDWNETTNTVSLFDWATAYLSSFKRRRPHSTKTYNEKRDMFKRFFKTIAPDIGVEDLTPAMVLDYLQIQMEERTGNASNKDRKNLVAGWKWGIRYFNLPKSNPCSVDKMPEQRHPRYIPPIGDFWKVYDQAENHDQVMLLTYLHTAGRRGEIFRLKVDDLDFDNSRLRLSTRKREDGTLEYDWLPMTKDLKTSLLEWLKTRPIKSEYVFVCLDQKPVCRQFYGKPFKGRQRFMDTLCVSAGVKPFGFHAIRHLTAQQLYNQGYSVSVIQAILRHKSPNTTERYLKRIGLTGIREALELSFGDRSEKIVDLEKAV